MAYTFRRASRAMAMTSSTTAAAFLANIFSPIMPIKSFGIYSGIIVPLNFFMTVTMFPSATIIYETYFSDCCGNGVEVDSEPAMAARKTEQSPGVSKPIKEVKTKIV